MYGSNYEDVRRNLTEDDWTEVVLIGWMQDLETKPDLSHDVYPYLLRNFCSLETKGIQQICSVAARSLDMTALEVSTNENWKGIHTKFIHTPEWCQMGHD